jgi:ferritin
MRVKLFEQYTDIENKGRLSDNILKLLNEQIKNELVSSQIYRAMSCYLDDKGWIESQKYYFKSAQEEIIHMEKIYEYIFEKNCKAEVPACEKVKDDYKNIRNVVEESLNHEMEVTENWNNIANTSMKDKDNDTYALSQWFLKEQVEEESKFRDILFKMNLDMPDYEIDELFGDLIK